MTKEQTIIKGIQNKINNSTVSFEDITKNNGVIVRGLKISDNDKVAVCIYPDMDNESDMIIEQAVKMFEASRSEHKKVESIVNNITDFEAVKDSIIPVLFNNKKSAFTDIVSIPFVYFYFFHQ